MRKELERFILCIVAIICAAVHSAAQDEPLLYSYSGLVTDSLTAEAIPFASVYVQNTTIGTSCDSEGRFQIRTAQPIGKLTFSFIGYKDRTITVRHTGLIGNVKLSSDNMLEELVVRKTRQRYKRKVNPAVDLIKRLLEHKDSLDPRRYDFYETDCYKVQTMAITNAGDMIERREAKGKNCDALRRSVDTSAITGQVTLPLFTEEAIERITHDRRDDETKTLLTRRNTLFEIIPEETFSTLMADAGREVNIYDNTIRLLFTEFTSPIATYGNAAYHYFITDTLRNHFGDGRDYIKLHFVPTSKENFGFIGHMLIAKDSSLGVRHIEMSLSEASKINFVQALKITQDYTENENGVWTLSNSVTTIEGNVLESAQRLKGLSVKMERFYKPYVFSKEESRSNVIAESAPTKDETERGDEWEELMPENAPDSRTTDIAELRDKLAMAPFVRFMNFTFKTIFDGHIPVGDKKKPKLHIGPIFSIISANHLEGVRLLAGAQTGTGLSKRWFVSGYGAYGFRDKKWKYMGEVEYSFIDKEKSREEYPRRSIRAGYTFDCDMPGNRFSRSRQDNILSSLRWQTPNQYAYFRRTSLTHTWEFKNGLSYNISLRHNEEQAADELEYRHSSTGELVDKMKTTDLGIELSYTPVSYYQMGLIRYTLTNQIPHIRLTYSGATKAVWSDYTYNKTEICYDQRFTITPVGYIDVFVKGGKVWDKVPYPLLFMPATNLTYFVQPETFCLMRNMEFINDQYASLEVKHYMEGWILSHIPILNKLKLREFWTVRALVGGLTDKNNPRLNPDDKLLFALPDETYIMNKPYMEASFGIYNILKFLQVEVARRINYLDNRHTNKWGFRFGTKITF